MAEMDQKRRVGGIILAAGASSRMNRNKLLLPMPEGGTVLGAVIDQALQAGLDSLVLVSGAQREQVEEIARDKGVAWVYNPDYAQGQSTSMKRGLAALPEQSAALFILGDQPLITAAVYRKLAETYRREGPTIVVPRGEDGERGNPSLIAPELFGELLRITGDVGGRPVLRQHIQEIHYVDVGGVAVLRDIDTLEQYQDMLSTNC